MENPTQPAASSDNVDISHEFYNKIFDILVLDEDDDPTVPGFIAYGIYKLAKREWVKKFCESKKRKPTDDDLRAYIDTWTGSRIDGVTTEASQALSKFSAYIIAQERPKIVEEALKEKSFWRDAWVGGVGAGMWTIALIIFAFVLKYFHIDALSIFKEVGH